MDNNSFRKICRYHAAHFEKALSEISENAFVLRTPVDFFYKRR